MKKTYSLSAEVWLYPGMAGWHFITLPTVIADEIRTLFHVVKRGWGSISMSVTIGSTTWQTSIFPDKKVNSYLLPLKSEVRKKEKIKAGDQVYFSFGISD